MLSTLLEIKKRREQRLRRQIQSGDRRQQENQKIYQNMVAQRDQLQQEWRIIGQQEHGRLTYTGVENLRRQLAILHQRDNQMEEHCRSLQEEEDQWKEQRQTLEHEIRRASIEQEKLKYLVEHHA